MDNSVTPPTNPPSTLNKNNGIFKGILVHYMMDLVREKNLPAEKRRAYIKGQQ